MSENDRPHYDDCPFPDDECICDERDEMAWEDAMQARIDAKSDD